MHAGELRSLARSRRLRLNTNRSCPGPSDFAVNYSAQAAVCAGLNLAYYVSADKTVTQSADMRISVTLLSCEAPALFPSKLDTACHWVGEQKQRVMQR